MAILNKMFRRSNLAVPFITLANQSTNLIRINRRARCLNEKKIGRDCKAAVASNVNFSGCIIKRTAGDSK